MANTFKNSFQANVSSNTVCYTAATGVQATLIGMTVGNVTDVPVTANVMINSGGVNYYLVKNAAVPFGGSLVPIGGDQKVVLEATDSLAVHCSGDCDVAVSILEIT